MKKYIKEDIDIFMYNVKYLREKNKLSLKEMSQNLDISVYYLRQIERGILPHRLGADIIYKIQKYFDISAYDLLDKKL